MKKNSKAKIYPVIFGIFTLYPILAIAALADPIGTIGYSPLSHSIPTLSGPVLIGLSLLLATLAYRVIRHSGSSNTFAIICSIGILGFGSTAGIKLIDSAQATPAMICASPALLSNRVGGQSIVDSSCNDQDVGVKNTSGEPLKIEAQYRFRTVHALL